MRMKLGLISGNAEAIFNFEEDVVDRIVFDRKANGFLWNMESCEWIFLLSLHCTLQVFI